MNTCNCCNTPKKNVRPLQTGHILCNSCNLKLIIRKFLRLSEDTILKVTGKRGDFFIVEAFQEKEENDFWANRLRSMELAQMDNQSMVGYEVHESY